jgi:hypothetical protein
VGLIALSAVVGWSAEKAFEIREGHSGEGQTIGPTDI